MDMLTLLLADLFLTAVRADSVRTEENILGKMLVTCTDRLSGKSHSVTMTDDELEAIVGCALSNSGEGTPDQYAIASKVCEGFPTECRPIP